MQTGRQKSKAELKRFEDPMPIQTTDSPPNHVRMVSVTRTITESVHSSIEEIIPEPHTEETSVNLQTEAALDSLDKSPRCDHERKSPEKVVSGPVRLISKAARNLLSKTRPINELSDRAVWLAESLVGYTSQYHDDSDASDFTFFGDQSIEEKYSPEIHPKLNRESIIHTPVVEIDLTQDDSLVEAEIFTPASEDHESAQNADCTELNLTSESLLNSSIVTALTADEDSLLGLGIDAILSYSGSEAVDIHGEEPDFRSLQEQIPEVDDRQDTSTDGITAANAGQSCRRSGRISKRKSDSNFTVKMPCKRQRKH